MATDQLRLIYTEKMQYYKKLHNKFISSNNAKLSLICTNEGLAES